MYVSSSSDGGHANVESGGGREAWGVGAREDSAFDVRMSGFDAGGRECSPVCLGLKAAGPGGAGAVGGAGGRNRNRGPCTPEPAAGTDLMLCLSNCCKVMIQMKSRCIDSYCSWNIFVSKKFLLGICMEKWSVMDKIGFEK